MQPDATDLRIKLLRRVLDMPGDQLISMQAWLDDHHRSMKESNKRNGQSGTESSQAIKDFWPHAPAHRVSQHGTFIVTAATLKKQHLFRGEERLSFLEEQLLRGAEQYGWELEAWAVFSNHYHFIGHSQRESEQLKVFLSHLHSETAVKINHEDNRPGRQVWHNFWDTQLTYETSYFARLNYVHQNAVRHRLVSVASHYRWCSASWFERTASPAQVATIYSFKTDRVKVRDDFEFDDL